LFADNGVAAPADWPNNEMFGDQVLLSPPGTEANAEARKADAVDDDELNYYDWWSVTRDQQRH